MKIKTTIASALLWFALCLITACSGSDTPPETTTPAPPPTIVANAKPDQSVFIGTFVTLNGSKSTNANGTGLTYAWTLKKPSGSNATLSNPILVNPTLTVDVEGTYEATLIVTDAQNPSAKSAPDTMIVLASKTNPPPVANAGTSPLNAFTGRAVLLNGRASSDANGDPLTFLWRIAGKPAGSSPVLLDAATVAPSFTPDIPGTYKLDLVVNDGTSSSTPASVTINASDKPSPTANAGPDQFVLPNTASVTLNGSGSRTNPSTTPPDLQYEWTINSSTFPGSVILTDPNLPVTTLKIIDALNSNSNKAGTMVAQLKVTDKGHPDPTRSTALDTVKVTVGPLATIVVSKGAPPSSLFTCSTNSCPGATVQAGTKLNFDATASEVQPLMYSWFLGINTTPFSTSGKPDFTLGADGSYTVTLRVTDLGNHTDSRSFTIIAKTGPVADFTIAPKQPNIGQKVTLTDTSAGTNLKRTWALTRPSESTTAGLTSTTDSSTAFTPDVAGSYLVKLTITDQDIVDKPKDSKSVTITTNKPPTAAITLPSPLSVCSILKLDGTKSSDPDGSTLTYSWSLTNPMPNANATPPEKPSQSALNDTTSSMPTFKADKQKEYTVSLKVTDSSGATDTTSTTFKPIQNPTGQAIFFNDGLTPIGACGVNCHKAGAFGSGPYEDISPALKYNIQFLTDKVLTPPSSIMGTKTIVTDLPKKIQDLREFLDSTLMECP